MRAGDGLTVVVAAALAVLNASALSDVELAPDRLPSLLHRCALSVLLPA